MAWRSITDPEVNTQIQDAEHYMLGPNAAILKCAGKKTKKNKNQNTCRFSYSLIWENVFLDADGQHDSSTKTCRVQSDLPRMDVQLEREREAIVILSLFLSLNLQVTESVELREEKKKSLHEPEL